MNRREFLKASTIAGCALPLTSISQLAFSDQFQTKPLLVILFLRGGADGLNLVAPAEDSDYIAARPAELRVLDSGESAGILLDRTNGFRLHASASGLAEMYHSGKLAIVHAVGITDGTRSHFVAQDLIERGVSNEKMLSIENGWLSRALIQSKGLVPGYSATNATVFALKGSSGVLSTPDIASGLGVPWGAQTDNLLRTLGMTGTTITHQATLAALDVLDLVDQRLPKDDKNKALPYVSSGSASYNGSGDLSKSLSSIARLSKMDVGLSVACLDHGGWDTHEGQSGRFNNQVKQLSQGLTAFHQDMLASNRPVITVVMTEFGRRLRANKSGGTDHGHGACWMVVGDTVHGGNLYGAWPGLSTEKLDQGVDLAVTTDYRALLYEVLNASGLVTSNVFPEWKNERPLRNLLVGI